MKLEEQAGYLQELKEAAGLDLTNPKQRLLSELADTVSMLCHQVWSLGNVTDGLNESMEALQEGVEYLLDTEEDGDEEYLDDGDNPLYEVKCPECGESFAVDEASLLKGFDCPTCGQRLIQA